MNKVKKIFLIIGGILLSLVLVILVSYNILISKVSNDTTLIEVNITYGMSSSEVINMLKDKGLIKNINITKIYMKLNNVTNIQAGTYELSKSMNLKEIFEKLETGKVLLDEVTVTFVEGKRIPYYVDKIVENFSYTKEEVNSFLEDREFLQELINKYWFITDDILNDKIYYPLEGYFFPDTYRFNKDASIKEIILTLIDALDKKLSPYKEKIESSGYTVHQILTLSSIVELEGVDDSSRSGVASVFINRIKSGWTLGSDVTTYYAEQKDFSVELTNDEYNACNAYNTRGTCFTGLPVGPICSAGLSSLVASIEPMESNYYYFLADKYKNTYFMATYQEFLDKKKELQNSGLWYVY